MVALSSTSVLAVAGSLAQTGPIGPSWWATSLVGALTVAFTAAIVSAARGSAPGPPATALMLTGLVSLVSAPVVAVTNASGSELGWPWHTAVATITGTAVLLRRLAAARGACVLGLLGLGLAQLRAMPPTSAPDGSRHLVDAAFLVALGVAVFSTTRGVEDVTTRIRLARSEAASAAAEAQALAASEADRARWEAAVHDDVLSALQAAQAANDVDDVSGRRTAAALARRALSRLAADPGQLAVGSGQVCDRIREAVTGLIEPADMRLHEGLGAVPAPVADAVIDAVVELVRNARRHNGPGVAIQVSGDIQGDQLRLRVADDGRGFDPREVGPARLGIKVSVQGRMHAVGGYAKVISSAERGTTAYLCWRR